MSLKHGPKANAIFRQKTVLKRVCVFNADFDIRVSRVGKKLHVEVLKLGKAIVKKNVEEGKSY